MVHCWPSETAAALLSSGYNFLKGSKSVWISSFLQTVGWPFVLFPLIVSYMFRRSKEGATTKLFYVSPRLFLASAVLGVLTGLGWFLFRLWCFSPSCFHFCFYNCHPVSLYCWICFCFGRAKVPIFYHQCNFLVDHWSCYTLILVLHTSSDRHAHETNKQYFLGVFMTLGTAALYGFVLPVVELTYKKAKQTITYTLVVEIQMVMSFFATAFCAAGMLYTRTFRSVSTAYMLVHAHIIISCLLM